MITLAIDHRYELGNVSRQSPYLQELNTYFGQYSCYQSAEDVLSKTLQITVSDSSIFSIITQMVEN